MLYRAIKRRDLDVTPADQLLIDLSPLLRRIFLTRGVRSSEELDCSLKGMLPPSALKGLDGSVALLHEALIAQKKIMVIGDFDADGATSTALALLGLRSMGAEHVDYLVPNRFKFGYGLSPEIVGIAAEQGADLIITVDNGIASLDGVLAAKRKGIHVLITDHHLPGEALPAADAILNPNQPGCQFPSKCLAGVGVVFYLLVALRSYLRSIGWFEEKSLMEPNLADYLDLVALGTVADVVQLDRNNRTLVQQGLKRIRAGNCRPGIRALLTLSKREPARIVASDLGFGVGPRLNAAGRLECMSLGIECLLATNDNVAISLAQELDSLNRERREIEGVMKEEAICAIKKLHLADGQKLPWGLVLYQPDWHQGVIGIVASRIKELHHRPVVAFAPAELSDSLQAHENKELKGSARSINGFHVRDALEAISTRYPSLILKFGGHAMAAGLSILGKNKERFEQAFDEEVRRQISETDLKAQWITDGELSAHEISLDNAEILRESAPWGQGFPEPLFDGKFEIIQQRIVGGKHLKLVLSSTDSNNIVDAIAFNVDLKTWPSSAKYAELVYQLDVNEFRGQRSVQLRIQSIFPVSSVV